MITYPACKADVYCSDGTINLADDPLATEFIVRVQGDILQVVYDDEEGKPVTYSGILHNGHAELACAGNGGRALMHWLPDSSIIQGSWSESGYEGMWRIYLSDPIETQET